MIYINNIKNYKIFNTKNTNFPNGANIKIKLN